MRILLASDASKYSEVAARTISTEFRTQGTEVLVLQAVAPALYGVPPQMAQGYAPELQDQLKQASESVERIAETLRKAGFKAESRVLENEIRSAILDAAHDWNADLIVLGSHGEKGLRKFLMGSVAESVARHAQCSVLIVRRPEDQRLEPA
ncbi:MAG: universal stress protein [Candidatus Acidiferrum sp.]